MVWVLIGIASPTQENFYFLCKKMIVSTLLKKILLQQGSLQEMTNLLFHRKINNLHNFLSVVYQYSKLYHTENGDEIKLKSLSHG